MKQVTITFCGVTATGLTKADAKQNAMARIEKHWTSDYSPELLIWQADPTKPPHVWLAWQTPVGISSAFVDGLTGRIGGHCLHEPAANIKHLRQQARLSLAQHATDLDAPPAIPGILAGSPDLISDYMKWLGFQFAYRHAEKTNPGRNAWEYHQFACNNSLNFTPKVV